MRAIATTVRGIAAATAILAFSAIPAVAQNGPPDASISLSGGGVALGVGYSWGKGTLRYQGRDIPFKIRGLSIVDIGASKYSASGSVFNLKNPEDLAGTYASLEAGATVGGGGSAMALKNDKGVIIHLGATRAGAQFTLAPKGMTISLK
ncbi:MAG: DUF1134 domain-containing protein [Caulobacter sp.]|nr:DUF1134 domain-containing protein [Caulobacter sp.]